MLCCRQGNPHTVHLERFGQVLAWFGPFLDEDQVSFLDRIEDTLAQKWFHGEISIQDADERLDGAQPRTYLVRFSSNERGAFTLSSIDKDRNKSHQRIVYHADKGTW